MLMLRRALTLLVLLAAAFMAVAVSSAVSLAQTPDDDGPPTVFRSEQAQSIVMLVEFTSPTEVEFVSGSVSHSPPPIRISGPPLIEVKVMDVEGDLIETFNDWHPLWVETELDDGSRGTDIAPPGEGRFIFPFSPDVGNVVISDIVLGEELIEIDARQVVLDYCAGTPRDPGCKEVPGPEALPGTGGGSPEDGAPSLVWAVVAAAGLAIVGGGLMARRRQRTG